MFCEQGFSLVRVKSSWDLIVWGMYVPQPTEPESDYDQGLLEVSTMLEIGSCS